MKLGVIYDEPNEVYHAANAVSKTKLDVFRENPELYRRRFIAKDLPKKEQTEAMLIGSAAGALILEGSDAFHARYVITPEDAPKRPSLRQINAKKPSTETKDAIAWWSGFDANNAGKETLTAEQSDLIFRMRAAMQRNPLFRQITERGAPEVTFRIQGERFAVQVRPDWWNEHGCELTQGYPVIFDLKTIDCLPKDDPEYLPRHIANFGYHRSAYLYPEVVAQSLKWHADAPRPRFFLGFVEKEEPHDTEVVELTEIDVEIGQREVTTALRGLRRCLETGVWKTEQSTPRIVSLPGYYVRRALETTESTLE